MAVTGYINENGVGTIRESFCAYFDILGFSEKIGENDIEYFSKYYDILQDEVKYLKERQKEFYREYEFKVFTDNFVFGYPWDDDDGEGDLGGLFDILSRIQYNFILNDIFIRGAIDHSGLFMDENIVFGPALIGAYKLESEKAIYPRIILSKNVTKLVKKHIAYYQDGESFQEDQYLIDTDGLTFLNYLYSILIKFHNEDLGDEKMHIEEKIMAHKEAIVRNLNKYSEEISVFKKYAWVANYHNHFCNNYLNDYKDIDVESLMIPTTLLERVIQKIQI